MPTETVDLGFDESWQAGQTLLRRQRSSVVFLFGDMGWTASESLPLLQSLF